MLPSLCPSNWIALSLGAILHLLDGLVFLSPFRSFLTTWRCLRATTRYLFRFAFIFHLVLLIALRAVFFP
jgi:hypothetical protein